MTQIEKLHLDAINFSREWEELDGELVVDRQLAASKSAQITEDIVIEFAEWFGKEKFEWNIKYNNWTSQLIEYSGCVYSTKELFKHFLKTKQWKGKVFQDYW